MSSEKWYFTSEQLTNSPSQKCGVDSYTELQYRQEAANLIQETGHRLRVSQLCINSAIVYMHRFYMFHSFTRFPSNDIVCASMYLSVKVEEQPRHIEHLIKAFSNEPMDTESQQYIDQTQDVFLNEMVILQTLGFDVAMCHPHAFVVKICQTIPVNKNFSKAAYFIATTTLRMTTMCLKYKPQIVACFCIYFTCKWTNRYIPPDKEGTQWFSTVDCTVTTTLLDRLTVEFLHITNTYTSTFYAKMTEICGASHGSINDALLKFNTTDSSSTEMQYITSEQIIDDSEISGSSTYVVCEHTTYQSGKRAHIVTSEYCGHFSTDGTTSYKKSKTHPENKCQSENSKYPEGCSASANGSNIKILTILQDNKIDAKNKTGTKKKGENIQQSNLDQIFIKNNGSDNDECDPMSSENDPYME